MWVIRPAAGADGPEVARLIGSRCDWMEEKGLPSWRTAMDDLVSQCNNPCGDVWVLELDGTGIVGRTTVQEQGPPWGWTDQERADAALYLTTTVTDPEFRALKPGMLIACWAVAQASARGADWVRRDCAFPELARYYQSQGYTLIRETDRKGTRLFMLARQAEPLHVDGLVTRTLP